MRGRMAIATATFLAGATGLIAATDAAASFPGTNGKIAFSNHPGTNEGNSDIYTMDPTGQNRTQLTTAAEDDYDPSYSADGERIVFVRDSDVDPFPRQISVMNSNGTGQTQLTAGTPAVDSEPQFSPDGTKIVFSRFDESAFAFQIWIMNADGSGQTQLDLTGH